MKNSDLHSHSYYSDGQISPKELVKIAKKYKLIITSGSDFHGEKLIKQMPGNHSLGKNNCAEKVVKKLKQLAGK